MENLNLIIAIKEYIELSLSEIMNGSCDFSLGQRYAYVEVLELLQNSLNAIEQAEIGLNYCIEEVYQLK